MGKQVPISELQLCVDTLARNRGNKEASARELKLNPNTFKHRIKLADVEGLMALVLPDTSVDAENVFANLRKKIEGLETENDRLRTESTKNNRPHFTIRQDNAGRTSKIRIVCIGDAHDSPNIPDKSRFEIIGHYINETKPDIVVQIGDFATLDSLNSHIGNHTYSGRAKPTFIADMASFNEALDAMQISGPEKHCTLGNHERRLWLAEEEAPHSFGMMQLELQKIFERHKWTYSPYGMPYTVGGVSFVHCAINTLGKSYGGKNAEGTIANDAIGDWVIGHSHRERMHRAAKLGGNNYVKIINVGCALPDGFIEDYAKHALTGWSYGIADLTIQHNHVQDYHFVSMGHLDERYGKS